MPIIELRSAVDAPSPTYRRSRWEIGHFFVNIYFVADRFKKGDENAVRAAGRLLCGCLGENVPMFFNERHPSVPGANTLNSSRTGTTEEMHDEPHKLGHVHVELIGAHRDTGFEALGVRDALVGRLNLLFPS